MTRTAVTEDYPKNRPLHLVLDAVEQAHKRHLADQVSTMVALGAQGFYGLRIVRLGWVVYDAHAPLGRSGTSDLIYRGPGWTMVEVTVEEGPDPAEVRVYVAAESYLLPAAAVYRNLDAAEKELVLRVLAQGDVTDGETI